MDYDISVIVPVYNSEAHLKHCFSQFKNQILDEVRLEIIFVDDGSQDDSLSMLNVFAKENQNVNVIHQSNQKQAAARNTGLRAARGTFVAFVDSDDSFSNKYFKRLFEKSCDADWVISGIERIFKAGTDKIDTACFKDLKSSDKILSAYASSNTEMDAGVWSKLYRRKFLFKYEIFFENGNFFEDSFFNLKVIVHIDPQRIRYIQQTYYKLVKQTGSTTTQFNANIDKLAGNYVNLCKGYLLNSDLSEDTVDTVIDNLIARTLIHVIHHHIKYDENIKKYPIKKIIKRFVSSNYIFTNKLPNSYRIALLMLRFFPSFYCYLYRSKKVGRK
ncbi:glycosyltransferase [Lactiplantibacillus brownii]|uniref:glycosyltransferase n=1 Tax=Lactiplantibacillus brownii TaxID=3069269 RepID=UPI0038B297DC